METNIASTYVPSIGELVTNDWRKAEVFKKYGIDFCCGGKRTVADACVEGEIDINVVESELEQIAESGMTNAHHFNSWELDFLVDYIVNNHHQYVTSAIPFLEELSAKVAGVHRDHHPELVEIEQYTRDIIQELTMHMRKEEMILFPYIKKMVEAKRNNVSIAPPPFGTIANPINMMEAEHALAGSALESIEHLSDTFTPPSDACMSYRVFFSKLQEFQADLHQHIHLENNILFPKALKLEGEVMN